MTWKLWARYRPWPQYHGLGISLGLVFVASFNITVWMSHILGEPHDQFSRTRKFRCWHQSLRQPSETYHLKLWLHVQCFSFNYFRDSGRGYSCQSMFPTRLICLQLLQRAAILACNNCTCNHSFSWCWLLTQQSTTLIFVSITIKAF